MPAYPTSPGIIHFIKDKKLLPSELVQVYRHRAGLTQTQFAALAGLNSKRMVQYWETGVSLPKPETLKKLVEGLLINGILIKDQEQEEAIQFWEAVKAAFDTRLENLKPYPVLDRRWLETLISRKYSFRLEPANNSPLHPQVKLPESHLVENVSQIKASPLPSLINLHLFSDKSPTHNLPEPVSSFIGRKTEAAKIQNLIIEEKYRLVTLVGAGGCGKTRLCLKVASQLVDDFTDGVWFVELASLSDPLLIAQTIATILGITEQAGRPVLTILAEYLRSRKLLLVIDNCEHVIEECARVVEKLLNVSSKLQILATSREIFNLSGEAIFRVPSLTLPDSDTRPEIVVPSSFEAIDLFIQRAVAANSDFSLTNENAATVVKLCSQLDGIPLAIELAAARIKVMSLGQLATRLDDRFRLLKGGSRTVLPRHQTLKALLDWSYDLLTQTEKTLLARLSVFAGGWSLNAAEEVCSGSSNGSKNGAGLEKSEVLDALSGLVNKSLVQLELQEDNGEGRYYFLETIRQYGLEKLKASGEEQKVRQRHLTFYASLAGKLQLKLRSNHQAETLNQWDRELDNMRAAIVYGIREKQVKAVFELTNNLYTDIRGYYSEGRSNLEQVLALPGAKGVSRGWALYWVGILTIRQIDLEAACSFFEECLALSKEYNDKNLQLDVFNGSGFLHITLGVTYSGRESFTKSRGYLEQALTLSKEIDENAKSRILNNLGQVLVEQGEYEEAGRVYNEAETLAEKLLGASPLLTFLQTNQTRLALVMGDYAAAHRYLDKGWRVSEEIGFHSAQADIKCFRGITWASEGKFDEARHSLEEGLGLCLKWNVRHVAATGLVGVARFLHQIWFKRGVDSQLAIARVACLCGAVTAMGVNPSRKPVLTQPIGTYYDQLLSEARSNLSEATFKKTFMQGQGMTLEEAISYACQALTILGL